MITKRVIQENTKFRNIDVIKFMERIVQKHVQHYQSDFDIDKEVLRAVAGKQKQQEKTFVWLCRTCGTWLLLERNVFIKDTREYNTVRFYIEQTSEPIIAFIVEVIGVCNDRVMGNMYSCNYAAYGTSVKVKALDADYVMVQYEHGTRLKDASANISSYPDEEYGKLQSFKYYPSSQKALIKLLHRERHERGLFPEGKPYAFLAMLHCIKKNHVMLKDFEEWLLDKCPWYYLLSQNKKEEYFSQWLDEVYSKEKGDKEHEKMV